LLNFVSVDVDNDYKTMLGIAEEYSKDAHYVDNLVNEFSNTSEELMVSIGNIIKAIDAVAITSAEGAQGSSDIANRIAEVSEMSSQVLSLAGNAKNSADMLRDEISKFKI
ncbi:MAG: methyl-accepting chemotaxis protein, partial [Bacillota bacterium]|nr:methyl-accepting chemotaxis protein [Bacillota bacterium]